LAKHREKFGLKRVTLRPKSLPRQS